MGKLSKADDDSLHQRVPRSAIEGSKAERRHSAGAGLSTSEQIEH